MICDIFFVFALGSFGIWFARFAVVGTGSCTYPPSLDWPGTQIYASLEVPFDLGHSADIDVIFIFSAVI